MKFRSGYEKSISDSLKKARVKFDYEKEKISYVKPATNHWYTPDFVIYVGKKKIYVEAKGYFDALSRKKMVLVKQSNPQLDIRLLFMSDNPIRKGSKTYYSDWAEKNGFIYAIGTEIPKQWLKV